MASILASSRKALFGPSSAVLLDVLAPTAFSTLSISSAAATRPSNGPSPSSSKVLVEDSQQPLRPTRKQRKQTRTAKDQPPVRTQRGRPPSSSSQSRAPSAVDLLSQIRNTASPATPSNPAVERHNEAVLSIIKGTTDPRRDFVEAFKLGWIPIRETGQVGRLQAKDLAKVLRTCTLIERSDKRDEAGYEWGQVRELVLWLAGEKDMAGLVDWAWSAIETGPTGCEQVVEVWDAIAQGEHLKLREGPSAINWAFQPKREFGSTAPTRQKPPVFLFAAYVAARSVTHRLTSPSERAQFASLLPALLDPAFPALHRWLQHSDAEHWLTRAFSTTAHDSGAGAFASAITWLRQVALAQIWYEQRSLPGLALVKHVRGAFRRSAHKQVWDLWLTLSEAVDNADFAWISAAEWESSARQRWINGAGSAALEAEDQQEQDPDPQTKSREPVTPPTAPPDPPLPYDRSAPLPPALLTQAIVNPFLSGFVRAQLLEQANKIWSWLGGRSPPLRPGIVTWNGLLSGYAQRGDVHAVENAWADLVKGGIKPSLWTWLARVDACFSSKRCTEAMQVWKEMVDDKDILGELKDEHGGRFPSIVWDKLINGLLANGKKEEAEQIIAEMDKAGSPPTIHSINLLLKFYTRGKNPDLPSVVRLLRVVAERDLQADEFTYTMVLVALLAGGQRDATPKIIQIMESSRVKPTVTTYGAIIHSLANSGDPEHLTAAVQLLDEMEGRKMPTNEIIYTSLIQGFLRAIPHTPSGSNLRGENEDGQHAYFRAALTLKTRMERRGIHLNRVGYNALLGSALALESDWGTQLALKTFKEMKRRPGLLTSSSSPTGSSDASLEPRDDPYSSGLDHDGRAVTASDTYFVLLDGFVKMKDWNRARGIVREMERSGFEVRNRGLRRLVERVGGGGSSRSY